MECNAVRLLLAFRRPGGPSELAPEDLAAIDQHLAGCPACAANVAQSARFDAAIATAMRTVFIPVNLKARVLTATLAQQGALWRHPRGRTVGRQPAENRVRALDRPHAKTVAAR